MEQDIIIGIGTYSACAIIVAIIGGVTVVVRKFTTLETKVDSFERRLTNMEGRLDNAFGGGSPLALLPKGEIILEDSGLKRHIEDNKNTLLVQCRAKSGMANPYDIQKAAFDLFDQLNLGRGLEASLKASAFKHGVNTETIRRVGGIYFRDICLEAAGFSLKDLDGPKE